MTMKAISYRRLGMTRPTAWVLFTFVVVACTAATDVEPPTVDRGIAPTRVQGFGNASGTFHVCISSPDALLILALEPPANAVGMVRLDVAAGLPGVRGVELATGAGREALLPSGPAMPVPDTVVRVRAESGTVFTERLRQGGVRVAARGLVFAGGRSIDIAPRSVPLGTYPPGVAVPSGVAVPPGTSVPLGK